MISFRNLRRYIHKAVRQPAYACRVFAKRLAASAYYRRSDGTASLPEAVTLFLTHRCNLHCKMCGQWGEGGVTKKQSSQYIKEELSVAELASLVEDVARFKPNITLFGGEPLLYPGFIEIVKRIKERKMHCLVITNGYLLEELAADIVESGLDELNVSLDGSAFLHDEIRGMPGLFNKIHRGLKEIVHRKEELKRKRPLINLQCTVTKYNYEKLETVLDVANEIGADSVTFHNLIFTNAKILKLQERFDLMLGASSMDWKGFDFEPGIEPSILYAKMREILSGTYSFGVDFFPNFSKDALVNYYHNPSFTPSEYPARCLSPWIAAYVFPDGEVRPCLNCTYSFGNVRSGRFADIWNSEKARQYRKVLKENRIFPACVRCTELYRY